MGAFTTPTDIANRAIQDLGGRRIIAPDSLAVPISANAAEMAAAYDKLRLAELQRNTWTFACRRTTIIPVSNTTVQITFPQYASGTTYASGDIVADSTGLVWVSQQAGNTGNTPGVTPANGVLFWDAYFGSDFFDFWNAFNTTFESAAVSQNILYDVGQLVYITPGDGTYKVYQSLLSMNGEQPNVVDAWLSTAMYSIGQVVVFGGVNYQSLVNLNTNFQPSMSPTQWTSTITSPLVSNSWRQIVGATIAAPFIDWPVASGPAEALQTRNIYRKPVGFLRLAPQKPKAGVNSYLGAPRYLNPDDWEFTGDYFVTTQTGPIAFRFGANVQDVTTMDTMFCEGLAARLGYELCERITQSTEKQGAMNTKYSTVMREARLVNAIEQGPITPALDSFITCRL